MRAKPRTVGLKAEAKGRAAPEATVVVPSRRDWITAGGKSRGPGNGWREAETSKTSG